MPATKSHSRKITPNSSHLCFVRCVERSLELGFSWNGISFGGGLDKEIGCEGKGVWSGTSGCKSSTTASYQILFKFNKPGGGRVRSVAGLRFFIGQSNVGHGRRRPEEKQGMESIRSIVRHSIVIRADLREAESRVFERTIRHRHLGARSAKSD